MPPPNKKETTRKPREPKKQVPSVIENLGETAKSEMLNIKSVKSNKARQQTPAPTLANAIETRVVHTNPDGTQLIRIKRTFNEPKPLKICQICGNTYKYQHALDSHMRRHRNEKPFECTYVYFIRFLGTIHIKLNQYYYFQHLRKGFCY